MNHPMFYVAVYLTSINLIAAVTVASDKYRARRRLWRVPERTLFLLAILGGMPGTYLTMKVIRHKTQHKRFMIGLPVILVLQLLLVAAGIFLWLRYGSTMH